MGQRPGQLCGCLLTAQQALPELFSSRLPAGHPFLLLVELELQIGQFQILIGAGHRVGAEGALVPRHGRGHAEPGIGVDVGRADEALHQLVGDVVILGQQLARDVEGNGLAAMLADGG